jgi:hypothetical protein
MASSWVSRVWPAAMASAGTGRVAALSTQMRATDGTVRRAMRRVEPRRRISVSIWLPQLAVIGDVKGAGSGGFVTATGFAGACAPPVVPGFGGIEVRAVQVAQGVVDRVDG